MPGWLAIINNVIMNYNLLMICGVFFGLNPNSRESTPLYYVHTDQIQKSPGSKGHNTRTNFRFT